MPRKETSLDASVREFAPYIDSYWRDFDGDSEYVGAVIAVHVDQAGGIVGSSFHVNGPYADWNSDFVSELLSVADGEVA